MSDAVPTPPIAPPPSMSDAASGLSQTSSIRLAPGAIPSTWTKPAEAVTAPPAPARRPGLTGALVGVGVVACVAVAAFIAPGSPWTPKPAHHEPAAALKPPPSPPAVTTTTTTPDGAKSIADVPAPAPPKPGVAPEDETGDDVKPKVADPPVVKPPATAPVATPAPTPPPTPAAPAASTTTAPSTNDVVGGELPNRKKAKLLTQKAIVLLRDGNYGEAEPVLVRAVLVDAGYAEGWRHLGIARAQLGDRDGARRAYKKYLALAPNAPDAADVKKILGAN